MNPFLTNAFNDELEKISMAGSIGARLGSAASRVVQKVPRPNFLASRAGAGRAGAGNLQAGAVGVIRPKGPVRSASGIRPSSFANGGAARAGGSSSQRAAGSSMPKQSRGQRLFQGLKSSLK